MQLVKPSRSVEQIVDIVDRVSWNQLTKIVHSFQHACFARCVGSDYHSKLTQVTTDVFQDFEVLKLNFI